ncbi:hypothetical protein AMAG_16891 [Allomyces macrogynus ATCC 38327]|uniref:Uncharacterized protein n=1 Tax=Allomyces macrogynus (strain ATCC 38327) TaxID=578462 RepID=A0A0L0TC69_ALLM3|nr:hypothetical protein AMAG_16891 [Allomyces macrogynus ATCC 38327]|eukprot:KNE72408.1 hypothetical protein AMAG_16891 [Allomyces macrogynus ATCC 38327]
MNVINLNERFKVPWVQLRVRSGELRLAVTPASHVVWSVLLKSPADVDGQVRGCNLVQPPGSPLPDPTLRELFDEWVNRPEQVRTEWTPPTADFWDNIAY